MRTTIVMVWALLLVVCVTRQRPSPDAHLLEFLHDGQTTRQEIVLQLGPPSRTMERGCVWFYSLAQSGQGYFVNEAQNEPWPKARCRLRQPDPGGKAATRSNGEMECWSAKSPNPPPIHHSVCAQGDSTEMTNRGAGSGALSLVLRLDERGVLKWHSLVKVP
jgi:hypothetical protein